jgi:hypothetical protein
MYCIGWSNSTRSLIICNDTLVYWGESSSENILHEGNPVKLINDSHIMIGSRLYNISQQRYIPMFDYDHNRTFGSDNNIIIFEKDKVKILNRDRLEIDTRNIHIPENVNIKNAYFKHSFLFYLTDNILFINGVMKKNGHNTNKSIITVDENSQFGFSKHGLIFLSFKNECPTLLIYSFMGKLLSSAPLPKVDHPEEMILCCPEDSDNALIRTRTQSFMWSLISDRQVGFKNEDKSILDGGWDPESYVFYKNNSLCVCNGNSQKIININSHLSLKIYPKDSGISGSNIEVS